MLPNMPLSVQTLREQLDASILPERLIAMLSALFGALAAVLLAIGLYGLLSYTVERRMNEIGIRIALGATSRDIVLMVGAGALPLVFAGFAVGAPIALVAKVYAGKVLTLVAATQGQAPITLPASAVWPIVGAAGAMIAVALIASCIPARRATRSTQSKHSASNSLSSSPSRLNLLLPRPAEHRPRFLSVRLLGDDRRNYQEY